jgi:hypothetical protein
MVAPSVASVELLGKESVSVIRNFEFTISLHRAADIGASYTYGDIACR